MSTPRDDTAQVFEFQTEADTYIVTVYLDRRPSLRVVAECQEGDGWRLLTGDEFRGTRAKLSVTLEQDKRDWR